MCFGASSVYKFEYGRFFGPSLTRDLSYARDEQHLAGSKQWFAGTGLGDAYAGIHARLRVHFSFSLVRFTLQKPKPPHTVEVSAHSQLY